MRVHTLPSGLRVVIDSSSAAPVVAIQVWVGVGSADETPVQAGLAHVHEHMLFKGTARRKVGEIAGDIEAAGGDINAYTSFDQTVYHVTLSRREFETGLDVLADAVQHSAFDPDELEKELEVVLEELRRGKDSPSRVVSELLFGNAFQTHTYGRPVIGFVETVEAFTREQILEFYRHFYRPRNMLLVVAGDVSEAEVLRLAEKAFPLAPGDADAVSVSRPAEAPQTEVRFAEARMDITETHLSAAWHGPQLSDPDSPVLDVLSVLLGTGESSRLYRRVRRDQELVTDAYAYAYTPKDPGLIGFAGQIQGQPLDQAFAALLTEVLRLRHEAPTPAELDKAKTIVLSEAVYGMQTVQGRARRLGYFELVAGGLDFEAKYREAVRSVTGEDLLRVARRWLDPHGLTVAVVRPQDDEAIFDRARVEALCAEVSESLAVEYRPAPTVEALDGDVARATLSNGIEILVQPDGGELVSLYAVGQGGLLDEASSRPGVAHLVGELLVRGTERFSTEHIIETCDAMAGGLAGQSGRNSLGLRGDFLRESWVQGLDLFASCLLEPTFPEEELARELRAAREDLESRADHPGAVAFDAFSKAMYGEHPYSWPVLGTAQSLQAITRDDIVGAYRRQLRPDALTIAVVGGVEVSDVVARLERSLGGARPHEEAGRFVVPPAPRELSSAQRMEVSRDKAQVQLVLGYPGLTLNDDRRFALELMTQVLGGQSGRLFLELRDRQSLAYSVGCFNLEGLAPGYVALHIGTHPDKLATAEAGMRAELDRMKVEAVTAEALAKAKRYLIGSYEVGLQRASSRASAMVLNAAYGLGYDAHLRHAEQLQAVTAEEVRDLANTLIQSSREVVAVVGPTRSDEKS